MTGNDDDGNGLPDALGGSWLQFVEIWCGGHAPGFESAVAIDALKVVGELWPESISGTRGLYPACGLIELGRWMSAVRNCEGFDALLPRLKRQDQGAHAELIVAGSLIRSGLRVRLDVPCQNHILDLAVEDSSGPVFVEVTAPLVSDSLEAQQRLIHKLMLRLGSSTECFSVFIEFTEDVTQELVEAVLAQLPTDESREWKSAGSTRFRRWPSPLEQREFGIDWPNIDVRTERIVHEKSKQLAKDTANVIAIDMTSLGASVSEWLASIRRLFQPAKNRRIGAIVLFQSFFSPVLDRGYRLWWVVENPHATHPIPGSTIRAFRRLDETDVVRAAHHPS